MSEPVLVTGGTGTLGRLVVSKLLDDGVPVRILSRAGGPSRGGVEWMTGDIGTGAGVDAAVDGIGTVIHCAGSSSGDDDKARHLVASASRAGTGHLVYVSVVGADLIPVHSRADRAMFGYFASKRAAENVIVESGIPWTTLRATQFHELILMVARQMTKLPVVPVPSGFRVQPVEAAAVADRLVELASGEPAGLVPDIAGPRVYDVAGLLREYLTATGQRRALVPLPLPGGAARAFRRGANLAPAHGAGQTWEDFLAELPR